MRWIMNWWGSPLPLTTLTASNTDRGMSPSHEDSDKDDGLPSDSEGGLGALFFAVVVSFC
jgi:hypothetical protein